MDVLALEDERTVVVRDDQIAWPNGTRANFDRHVQRAWNLLRRLARIRAEADDGKPSLRHGDAVSDAAEHNSAANPTVEGGGREDFAPVPKSSVAATVEDDHATRVAGVHGLMQPEIVAGRTPDGYRATEHS